MDVYFDPVMQQTLIELPTKAIHKYHILKAVLGAAGMEADRRFAGRAVRGLRACRAAAGPQARDGRQQQAAGRPVLATQQGRRVGRRHRAAQSPLRRPGREELPTCTADTGEVLRLSEALRCAALTPA